MYEATTITDLTNELNTEDETFHCSHCGAFWPKAATNHSLYIEHIKECLELHIKNLRAVNLVSFGDNTYDPRLNERTRQGDG